MRIYKTINLLNNKIYIGQTNGKRKSYIGGGFKLKASIKKYGYKNFKCEILESNLTIEEADIKEKYYINLYDSTNSNIGYNIIKGGRGYRVYSEFRKEQDSILRKGLKKTTITRERMSISKIGTKQSKETIKKRAAKLNKKVQLIDNNGCVEMIFNSILECSRYLKCNPCTISRVISGKYKSVRNKTIKIVNK